MRSKPTLAILLALLAACAGGPSPEMQTLTGTTWRLAAIEGRPSAATAEARMTFEADQLVGHTGINRFSGTWSVDGAEFSAGPFATTRAAGPPVLMEQERGLLLGLESAERITLEGDRLVLSAGDVDLLVFERVR